VRARIQLPFNTNPSSDVSTTFVSNIGLLTPNARTSYTQEGKQVQQTRQHSNLIKKSKAPEPDSLLKRDESLALNIMAQSAFDSNVKSDNDSHAKQNKSDNSKFRRNRVLFKDSKALPLSFVQP